MRTQRRSYVETITGELRSNGELAIDIDGPESSIADSGVVETTDLASDETLASVDDTDSLVSLGAVCWRILPDDALTATTWAASAEAVNAAWATLGVPIRVDPFEWNDDEIVEQLEKEYLDRIRRVRAARRRTAISLLMSPQRDPEGREAHRPHEVYLLHFPAEHCFKVGLSRVGAGRVKMFHRHGAIEVDRIIVASRRMAELIEANVLSSVERWHRLGDRGRPGGGYTEMWSDDGPTVDLRSAATEAEQIVEYIRHLCETP